MSPDMKIFNSSHWRHSGVFIINMEHILNLGLFLLLLWTGLFGTLLYNVTTIYLMDKIYSFVLIYWSQLFIYCQNLSLILIKREIYQFTQKLPREW